MVMLSHGMTGNCPSTRCSCTASSATKAADVEIPGERRGPARGDRSPGVRRAEVHAATGTAPGQDLNLNMTDSPRTATSQTKFGTRKVRPVRHGGPDRRGACALAAEANAFETTDPSARGAPHPRGVDHLQAPRDGRRRHRRARPLRLRRRAAAYSFFYDDADWLIEGAKSRLYGEDAAAKRTALAVTLTSWSARSGSCTCSCPTSPRRWRAPPPGGDL